MGRRDVRTHARPSCASIHPNGTSMLSSTFAVPRYTTETRNARALAAHSPRASKSTTLQL